MTARNVTHADQAIARGRAWFEELAAGRARSLRELAERDGITVAMSGASSTSPFLSPELVRRSCTAGQPVQLTATRLTNSICRSTGPISASLLAR